MEFSYESFGKIGVFVLKGNLIGENDGISLAESFAEQLGAQPKKFVIDLSDLQHINSSGLGVLITLLTKARKSGGDVFLANPSDYIRNLLVITKLTSIFHIYATKEEAISDLA
ncbi:MAG: STAS domain-containing protein [Bacteroidia bacterium]|nr:STAS domain-containing protein [Bacteroidia bacterium]